MTLNKFEKPFYYLNPTINCAGRIFVNDVPVAQYLGDKSKEGMLTGQSPINHVVLEGGKYKVRGEMFPRPGNNALTYDSGMTIEFKVYDNDNWKETRLDFSPEIHSPKPKLVPNDDPNAKTANKFASPVEGLPVYKIETEIEVELPFKLDGWQNSLDLSTMEKGKLFEETYAYYLQIFAVLREHNAPVFWEMSKEKEELQAAAFYFNEKQRKEIRQSIVSLFNENLEVIPLNEEELKMEVWGNGKLVSLIRKDGTPALQFKSPDPEKEGNVELDIKLHKRSEEKGFSII